VGSSTFVGRASITRQLICRILGKRDWHGLASVGFMRDENTGEFKLLEINPRFWSSLPSVLMCSTLLTNRSIAICDGRCRIEFASLSG